ncbi:MAG: hypothetical protein ACRDPW_05610, partial [Mycobacteriales bacterium]
MSHSAGADSDGDTPQHPDLRLAAPALATWGATLWVLHHSAAAGLLLAAAAAVGVVVLSCSARSAKKVALLVVAMACVGAVLGAGATSLRVAARDASPVTTLAARHEAVGVVLQLTDDPRLVGAKNTAAPTYLVRAKLLAIWPCDRAFQDSAATTTATDTVRCDAPPGSPSRDRGRIGLSG